MSKNICFYSNNCKFCVDIIDKVKTTPLKDELMYVCVDDPNIQLPNFISVVPTIYLIKEKRILVDEELEKWILGFLQKENIDSSDIQAYYQSGFASSCSLLDGSCDMGSGGDSGYSFLTESSAITTPSEDSSSKGNSDKSYESFVASRQNFSNQGGNNNNINRI